MLLFQKRFHAGIVSGDVTLTFRQWERPHVRPGRRYRVHPIGVVEVERIERVRVGDISEGDARRSGFASRAELLAYMAQAAKVPLSDETAVFAVSFHHAGEADRVPLATEARLSASDVEDLSRKLARLDRQKKWTAETLELIRSHPRVAASKLAKKVGRETAAFKADVRKLKRLGLTQSFEVGYALTPRGRAYLRAYRRRPAPRR